MIHTALLFFLILACPFTAQANEQLRFQAPDSYKENKVIEYVSSINKKLSSPLLLAKIDLNADALDEYIIRAKDITACPQNKLCPYVIIALQDHKPIQIGQFDAHKILISNKKNYGIRQIIVYNDAYNDFKNVTAHWNPFSFSFEVQ
jgi:hypothetical protein